MVILAILAQVLLVAFQTSNSFALKTRRCQIWTLFFVYNGFAMTGRPVLLGYFSGLQAPGFRSRSCSAQALVVTGGLAGHIKTYQDINSARGSC